MWFLIVIGAILVIAGWILGTGSIDFSNVDEKSLAGSLNQFGWALIIIGVVVTVVLIVLVFAGVAVGALLGIGR